MKWNILSVLLTSLVPAVAFALEPPFIVEEVLEQEALDKKSDVETPDARSLSTAQQQEKVVHVNNVQFQGGSVFELKKLAELVKPLIKRDVTKAEIVAVLNAITEQYIKAGYVLSFASLPSQKVENGLLKIVLVEGYIARQEIVIEDENVKARVKKFADKMQGEKPLTKATFERYAHLIEATPGYKFKLRVPKPRTYSGGTTIRVEEVSAEPVETTLGVDDSESEDTKLLAGVTFNSLSASGDKLNLSTLIPNDTVDQYYALAYQQDIGDDGLRIAFSANHFESQNDDRIFVADIPLNFEENKDRDKLKIGIKYPLKLAKKTSWWLGADLHYLDEDSLFELQRTDDPGNTVEIDKELRYSALEVSSNWTKQSSRQIFRVSGSIKQGLEIGSNKNTLTDSNGTRSGSETLYFNTIRLDGLWRYMMSSTWRFQAKANVFWSDDILPSAEQIRYGGSRYGKGYVDGQAQGDEGVAGEIELRYLHNVKTDYIKRLEPYVVFDAARAKLRASNRDHKLSSTAIGMSISGGNNNDYAFGVEYAKPLADRHFETGDRTPIYNLKFRLKL